MQPRPTLHYVPVDRFLWVIVWFACAVHVSRHNAAMTRIREDRKHEEQMTLLRLMEARQALEHAQNTSGQGMLDHAETKQ